MIESDSGTIPKQNRIIRLVKRPFPTGAQWRENRSAVALFLLSAFAGGLLFHQNWLGLLGWVALVPVFVALPRLEGKLLAWTTVLFGFIWYYLGCFWLHTLVVFHWLIPVGVAAGAFYYGLYFLLFTIPAAWCMRRLPPVARPWALAACWTAVEYLRNFTDMAFPWNLLGHSQFPFNNAFMQLASFGGIYIISFIMALVNGFIACSILAGRKKLIPKLTGIAIGTACLSLVLMQFQRIAPAPSHPEKLNVAVIQPGISQLVRWNAMMGIPGQTDQEWAQLYQQTEIRMEERIDSLVREAGAQHPAFIVLPESPFLVDRFPYQLGLHEGLWNLARATSATLFLGADNIMDRAEYDKLSANGQHFLSADDTPASAALRLPKLRLSDNGTTEIMPDTAPLISLVSAWQITPRHGIEPYVYNKMQLVPFGENVPFIGGMDWLVNALDASGIAGRFRPGLENTIFQVNGHKYGAVICFESTFSYLTRNLARAGAQFICVLTNDSWYDPSYAIEQGGFWGTLFKIPGFHQLASAGPKQHLIQSQLRAIETGLPVVRSANTGISALINDKGQIQDSLVYGESGYVSGEIFLRKPATSTIAVRYGEWVGKLCLGFWLAIVLSSLLVHYAGRTFNREV